MSQEIDLCEDSDDNGELTNTASVASLPLSRKRPRNKEELFNDSRPCNDHNPGNKTATGSAKLLVDLELAEEVEVSPHKKRCGGARKSKPSVKNSAAGDCAQILEGVEATVQDAGSDDSEHTSRVEDGSANKDSRKLSTSKSPSNGSGRQSRVSAWEGSMSELANYRKIHGHCNVPQGYSENTKLAKWVKNQRCQYRLHLEGKKSSMTTARIQELVSLGFEWGVCHGAAWEDRLSELADYRKIHGHSNVPYNYSENVKLAEWVHTQRTQHRFHVEGNRSSMTLSRIQELESLGFDWKGFSIAWDDRLSELADYRKIHGHCNVPYNYSENVKLAKWIIYQRQQYRLHVEEKRSHMTLTRIQELESLAFEWKRSRWRGAPKKPSLDEDTPRVRERAVEAPEHMQQHSLERTVAVEKSAAIKSTSLSNPENPTAMAKSWSTSTISRVEPQNIKRIETEEARFDETDLDGSPSELVAKVSLYSDSQAAESLSPEKAAPACDSVKSNTRDDAPQAKLPRPVHQQQKSVNSFSHAAVLVADPQEHDFIVAAHKPASWRQDAECQLETAPCNEILRANTATAEPQKRNLFTHALLLGDGSTGNLTQDTPDESANAPSDTPQTPPDEFFQSDNVLNEVELELNWLGEESMYCLSCPEFQFDFIYEYASPALKVELRKLSWDDQSEMEKLKQIVRMDDRLVSRRFDFVRNYIRKVLGRGFRRQRMRTVIAELRLLRRQQSKRHFPAL
jgi:hypothetical protein